MNKSFLLILILLLTSCNLFNSKDTESACDNLVLTDETGLITGEKGDASNQWIIPGVTNISVKPAYPNPSSTIIKDSFLDIEYKSTRLEFTIPSGMPVRIEVENNVILNETLPTGTHAVLVTKDYLEEILDSQKECIRFDYIFNNSVAQAQAHGYVLFE